MLLNTRVQRTRVVRCGPGSPLARHPSGRPENRRPSGPLVAAVLLSIVAIVSCRNSKPLPPPTGDVARFRRQ